MADTPGAVLFACNYNAVRSPMAEGLMKSLYGHSIFIDSVGVRPTEDANPFMIEVMAEIGIDISGHTSDHVDDYIDDDFDLVVTVCDQAKEACPVFPSAKRTLHRAFEDPDYPWMDEKEFAAVFRRIRDAIGAFSRDLLASEVDGYHPVCRVRKPQGNGP